MIIVVSKIPKIQTITKEDLDRLAEFGLGGQYADSEKTHNSVLDAVITILEKDSIYFNHIPINLLEANSDKLKKCTACITVGGDGTVLAAQKYLTNQPVIAINSDPKRSQGFLTTFSGGIGYLDFDLRTVARSLQNNEQKVSLRRRLQVSSIHCDPIPFLNDVLYTNENPSVMSEYVISCSGRLITERQRSSGVWISTPQGSTGAIHSAGVHPVPIDSKVSLFKVREPYHGHGRLFELEGWFGADDEIRLVSATKGMRLYLDGSHLTYSPLLGEEVSIGSHLPLKLVVQ